MISQVLTMTLKPDMAGKVNELLKPLKARLAPAGPDQVLVLENRNRRTVQVIAIFKDKPALERFVAQASALPLLDEVRRVSAADIDTYEALTEVI
jgi:hypothetical protein